MANQRKPSQTTATFTIPKHLLAWVQQEAAKRGQSTSEYIRHLLLKQWDEKTQIKK
jgi:predicted DNA binding CopG/RHH family protein